MQAIELIVHSLLGQKLLMTAGLLNPSFMQHDDLVRMLNRGETMRYNQCCPSLHQLFQGILNQFLRLRIDIGCRLVQNQNRRLECQRPRKGKKLTLPRGQSCSALVDLFIVSSRKLGNKGIGIDILRSLLNLRSGDTLHPADGCCWRYLR